MPVTVHGDPRACLQPTLLDAQENLALGGESQKRKQPGKKFSNISIDLGCFHLAQDGIWGQTRLGSPPPPAPSPFIYAGATLPGCKPRPAAPAAASPPSRSFNPVFTAPFPQTAARQPLLLATSQPQTPLASPQLFSASLPPRTEMYCS